MKTDTVNVAKGVILGISVVVLGALGVAGGKRTVQGIKLWFQSLVNKG